MDSNGRPSLVAAAAVKGGGTSSTAANSTTSAPRQRGAAKQATTHRDDQSLLRLFRTRGQPLGQSMCGRGGYLAKLNYMDIKKMLDRQQALSKKGTLTDGEIKSLVKEWHDNRTEAELNHETVEMELKAMEKKLTKYNVERLGDLPNEQEDGTMRVLICYMGGCASRETREIKMAATERLIRTYDINLCAFMELNFNWSKVNLSANLASWLQDEERKLRSVTAHNTTKLDDTFGKHQPGGTGILCRHEFLQYARKPSVDPRGLGWWCSWPFYCNPTHVTRIVVAYRPCNHRLKGLKTVYQ